MSETTKEKCEICNENNVGMDFDAMAPSGASWSPEVSDAPPLFKANICLDCFGKEIDDAHVVLAVVKARKET